ncbi:MAG: hypothetical protein LBU87_00195, partial [Lactobacillales bacterium]|nr:hypothetical protein [Lactobacillales bacterium]
MTNNNQNTTEINNTNAVTSSDSFWDWDVSDFTRLVALFEGICGPAHSMSHAVYESIFKCACHHEGNDLNRVTDFLCSIFLPHVTEGTIHEKLTLLENTVLPVNTIVRLTSEFAPLWQNGGLLSVPEMYALLTGSPFIITGHDYSNTVLGQAGLLDCTKYSTDFLKARAAYLCHLMEANAREDTSICGGFFKIIDDLTGAVLGGGANHTAPLLKFMADTSDLNGYFGEYGRENHIFGSQGTDHISGQDKSDKLYGEGGRDFLYGNGGDDYLFGGAGEDYLDG